MRSLFTLFALALALASPAEVYAQSCGGGGGGGGGSGGGGGGSGGSSDDEESPCADDSSITGLSECHTFGRAWDVAERRAWSFGVHGFGRQLRLNERVSGSASHENIPHDYSADLSGGWIGGVAIRLQTFFWKGLSVGLQGEVATGSIDSAAGDQVEFDTATSVGATVFVGGQIGIGNLKLALELAAGRHHVRVSGESQVDDCITSVGVSFPRWSLGGRIALRYFTGPNSSLEVGLRYDAINREFSTSLGVSLHTRSWDRSD